MRLISFTVAASLMTMLRKFEQSLSDIVGLDGGTLFNNYNTVAIKLICNNYESNGKRHAEEC